MAIIFCIVLAILIALCMGATDRKYLVRKYREMFGKRPDYIYDCYIDSKQFYLYLFGSALNTSYIDDIEIGKAFKHIKDNYNHLIEDIYQSSYFNKEADRQEFSKTVMVLKDKMIVQLVSDYVQIYYSGESRDLANSILKAMIQYQMPPKTQEHEINIIAWSGHGLELKQLDIKPTALDLDLIYNDDFKEVDSLIKQRLNQDKDKGIVLLHGLPGTGKTTYLRHLICGLKKRVLFVSPSAAANLMNPDFVDILVDNPNCVLIIEDAENIMMDRKFNHDSSVSNLLNLSDGLLSDCLSVQVICTFNSRLDLIDSALMRKGRLIARYEFGKLSTDKAQKLSTSLGFNTQIREPMTIAEIANQHETESTPKTETIGFRRTEIQMN